MKLLALRRHARRLYWNARYVAGRGRGTAILRRQLHHMRTVIERGSVRIQDSIWGSMTIELPAGYVMTSDRGEKREGLLAKGWLVEYDDRTFDTTPLGLTVFHRYLSVRTLYLAHLRGG